MRKLFFLLVALFATTCLWAHDFEVNGIYYNILTNKTNEVEVTYQGYYYYSYSNEYSGSVTIPETVTYDGTTYSVTSIGDDAFSYCSSLTSITIPNSVTSIGSSAFDGCSSLTSMVVESGNTTYDSRENCNAIIESSTNTLIAGCQNTVIPNSVTSIADAAFNGCSSLTSITIPNSVTSIGDWAFAHCFALTLIIVPNGVTSIGMLAFCECTSLTSITIPESVMSIGDRAFYGCSALASMVIEDGNTTYDSRENSNAIIETATNMLIEGCRNTIIPNSVTSIGNYAFENRSTLTSITIPNSVTSIGKYAFRDCFSLTSITIPESVASIGDGAFYNCHALTLVTINSNAIIINTNTKESNISHIFGSQVTDYIIGKSITSIGQYTFYDCSKVASITVEKGNTMYDSRENSNAIIETATNTLITGCPNTTIPYGIINIGDFAFYNCSTLTSITIPNSVTNIGNNAFQGCSSLGSITLPSELTSIGDFAFSDCSSLITVICAPLEVPETGTDVFLNLPLSIAKLYVPAESLNDYKTANQWKNFNKILTNDFLPTISVIDSSLEDWNDLPAEYIASCTYLDDSDVIPELPEDVISCVDAVAICEETGEIATTESYTIRGYVTEIRTAYSNQYGNITFWIADNKDGGRILQAYRVKPTKEGEEEVKVGDYVEVIGKLTNYYGNTPEVTQGGSYTILIPAHDSYDGLLSMKAYADETYLNLLVEYNPEVVTDLTWTVFHVYIDTDNSTLTGGFGDQWTTAAFDVLLETAVFAFGQSNLYNHFRQLLGCYSMRR